MEDRSSRALSNRYEYMCVMYNRRLFRAYLFRFPFPSSEYMAHSEVVMACGIGDESCVLNNHVDGERACHTSTSKLLGVHRESRRVAMRSTADVQVIECLFAHCGRTQPTRPTRTHGEGPFQKLPWSRLHLCEIKY
jgi:hypothetical protein